MKQIVILLGLLLSLSSTAWAQKRLAFVARRRALQQERIEGLGVRGRRRSRGKDRLGSSASQQLASLVKQRLYKI
jgi:hypothetical protein